jgi:hypothetical protein
MRDEAGMVPIIVPLLAAAALGAHPLERRKKPHTPAPASALTAIGPSVMQERALRRRVVRLARIKMLERRQAMLLEFLAKSHAQTPLFADDVEHDVGGGIFVGPTMVTLDFLGSAVVRVRVRNASHVRASPLLTAHLRTADGTEFAVSAAVEPLEPGASRQIDVASPTLAAPVSLTWSAMP